MDRNLGAMSDKFLGDVRGNGMYYQFGRKDPFPGSNAIHAYDHAGNRSTGAVTNKSSSSTGQGGKNVPYSVRNPLYFIGGAPWTSGDVFNPSPYVGAATSIVWQDPAWNVTREENEEGGKNATKSFFDPCPAGWRLPVDGWLTDLSSGNTSTTSTTANFIWNAENDGYGKGRGIGGTYFPNGFLNDKNNPNAQTIFFPASGGRDGGTMRYVGVDGYCWSSSPSSATYGYYLYFYPGYVNPSNGNRHFSRSGGLSVRCVKE